MSYEQRIFGQLELGRVVPFDEVLAATGTSREDVAFTEGAFAWRAGWLTLDLGCSAPASTWEGTRRAAGWLVERARAGYLDLGFEGESVVRLRAAAAPPEEHPVGSDVYRTLWRFNAPYLRAREVERAVTEAALAPRVIDVAWPEGAPEIEALFADAVATVGRLALVRLGEVGAFGVRMTSVDHGTLVFVPGASATAARPSLARAAHSFGAWLSQVGDVPLPWAVARERALATRIVHDLARDGEATLAGLCDIERRTKPERTTTNPQTGEPVVLPPRTTIVARPFGPFGPRPGR